jgi:hypothetical protein
VKHDKIAPFCFWERISGQQTEGLIRRLSAIATCSLKTLPNRANSNLQPSNSKIQDRHTQDIYEHNFHYPRVAVRGS